MFFLFDLLFFFFFSPSWPLRLFFVSSLIGLPVSFRPKARKKPNGFDACEIDWTHPLFFALFFSGVMFFETSSSNATPTAPQQAMSAQEAVHRQHRERALRDHVKNWDWEDPNLRACLFAAVPSLKEYYSCCAGCPVTFSTEAELLQHHQTHHSAPPSAFEDHPLQCPVCGLMPTDKRNGFFRRSNLTRHIKASLKPSLTCCGRNLSSKPNATAHLVARHADELLESPLFKRHRRHPTPPGAPTPASSLFPQAPPPAQPRRAPEHPPAAAVPATAVSAVAAAAPVGHVRTPSLGRSQHFNTRFLELLNAASRESGSPSGLNVSIPPRTEAPEPQLPQMWLSDDLAEPMQGLDHSWIDPNEWLHEKPLVSVPVHSTHVVTPPSHPPKFNRVCVTPVPKADETVLSECDVPAICRARPHPGSLSPLTMNTHFSSAAFGEVSLSPMHVLPSPLGSCGGSSSRRSTPRASGVSLFNFGFV
jgi:hypothetical protein